MACNIAAFLPEQARRQPDALALVVPAGRGKDGRRSYRTCSNRQLDDRSDRIARGLLAYGLCRGDRAVLMVTPGESFFALTFALFKAGIVPVLVDPGLGIAQLDQCIGEAEPIAFIGVAKAHLARALLGWGRHTLQILVSVDSVLGWGGATLAEIEALGETGDPVLADTGPDDLAAVLFTSGSTGPAKGVEYLHRHFVAQVECIRAMYGIEPGEIDLPTFPLFALFDPALDMTTVVPSMDFTRPAGVDPAMLAELIDDWRVTNVFGSPALLATVAAHGVPNGVRWPTVRRVLSAGAPVPWRVLDAMHRILPADAQVFTPYGATESLPVASIGSREVLAHTRQRTEAGGGVCVGRPPEGVQVRVIAIDDGPLPTWDRASELRAGEIGELCVYSPTTTRAYFGRPNATALAKIDRDGQTWHRMGDVGYFDDQGQLWYCGRKGHRVELSGRTLHTAPVEEIFNTHASLRRSALVGVLRSGRVVPVVCIELRPDAPVRGKPLAADLAALADRHDTTCGIDTFLEHPGFPVDVRHNAKIGREKLAVWAQARLGWR
ncbi:MAG: AMP-binding protein [Deltaproteobacteria bacterium]|nr:AMP-binding protein [Deltaproteobacteria bacterium]